MSRHVFRAQDYIGHMLEACTRITTYTAGKSLEDFRADRLTQDAVTRNLEILGEASKQLRDLLPNAQELFPNLPFRSLYNLRNRMIHAYTFTNYSLIFELAVQEVPQLALALSVVLTSWPSDPAAPPDKF